MQNVVLRRYSVIVGIAILAAGVGINMWLSSLKTPPARNEDQKNVPSVKVSTVANTAVSAQISLSGRLNASEKIEVFPEVTGKMLSSKKPFKDGTFYRKGEVLLQIDDTDFRMNLNASRSNFISALTAALADIKIDYPSAFDAWERYAAKISPTEALPELPETSDLQLKRFLAAKGISNQYFSIKALEAQLDKYQLIAPFSGVLSNASINANTVVRAGQSIGVFLNPNAYELEAGVPLIHTNKLQVGQPVTLRSNDVEGEWQGKILRVGKSVDATTQTVKVYVSVQGDDLYEGMYLSGTVAGNALQQAVRIPRHLVVDNRYVYTVKQGKLKRQAITKLHENQDEVVIAGLTNGTLLAQQIIPGAADGMPVKAVK